MENETISEEKLDDLKKNAIGILSNARQKLLSFYPFTGAVAIKLDIVPVRDSDCPTACTDGTRIFFSLDYLSTLNTDEVVFILAHEVWHVVLMHLERLQSRDEYVFNFATDCEVNQLLKNDGLIPPQGLVFPSKNMIGKSAEEIYEMLIKDKNKAERLRNIGKSSKKGNPQFDKHIYNNNTNPKEYKKTDTDKWGNVGKDPDFKPSFEKDLKDRIREKIISAAHHAERVMQGNLPANVKAIVDRIEKPEIKWQDLLSNFITTSFSKGERTWLPPNRRYVWQNVYLPSSYDEKLNVVVAIDTSGSTQKLLGKFFSELKSLVDTFGNYSLKVIQCDLNVTSFQEYDYYDNPFIFNPKEYEFVGMGGTSFIPVFDYIKDNNIETNCLIYLTDGYGNSPEQKPDYPVLWIISKDGTDEFCDWGEKVFFND